MSARLELGPTQPLWRGPWALARLVTRGGSQRRAFRSALWSGVSLALLSTPLIAVLARTSAADATDILAVRVLAYASWLVGGFGAWAFFGPGAVSPMADTLARERGFSTSDLGTLWSVGVAVRLAQAIFLITLLPQALLLPAVAAYATLLGGVIAALGSLARRLTPRHPRATLALLVLLPYFASFWFSAIPSVPGVFGWLLDGLIALGGWLQ